MVVGGNLNSPLNLFISFAKALMEQGFRSDLFLAKDRSETHVGHHKPFVARRKLHCPATSAALQNAIFNTACATRYASPLDTMAVEVEVARLWQQAVPKLGDRMLVEPTVAPLK